MFPNNFKISKQIDFDKLMKNYIIKNYGKLFLKFFIIRYKFLHGKGTTIYH